MIPAIGFMVGAYIFTRCIEILVGKETNGATSLCAIITIIVVIISTLTLLFSGAGPR